MKRNGAEGKENLMERKVRKTDEAGSKKELDGAESKEN